MKKVMIFFLLVFWVAQLKAEEAKTNASITFIRAPFISPKIVKDLCAWVSDAGDQAVAINLLDSQGSNRYFGDIQTRKNWAGKYPCVFVNGEGEEFFSYQLIGQTTNGIYVLQTSEGTGGSGVFEDLLLVTIEKDMGFAVDWDKKTLEPKKNRILLKKLGSIPLGDRWMGTLKVEGNKIYIGKNEGDSMGKGDKIDGRMLDVSYWIEIKEK